MNYFVAWDNDHFNPRSFVLRIEGRCLGEFDIVRRDAADAVKWLAVVESRKDSQIWVPLYSGMRINLPGKLTESLQILNMAQIRVD